MQSLDITGILATARGLVAQLGTPVAPGIAQYFTVAATGRRYVGTKTTLKKEYVNSDAGLNATYLFSVVCDASQFTTTNPAPAPKARVLVGGVTYKIIAVETDGIGATIRFHLGSEYDR